MNELTRLALELQGFCEARRWSFCLIGGLAVQHRGEPRFTKEAVKEEPEILARLKRLREAIKANKP